MQKVQELKYYCESNKNFFDSVNYVYSIMDLPVFTLNRQVKENIIVQYTFSPQEQSYLRVIPSGDPEKISRKILQQTDEKIFSAILRIAEYQKSNLVITDYYSLAKIAGLSYSGCAPRIKDSIQRLSGCSLKFNNIENYCHSDFSLIPMLSILTFKKPGKAAEFDIENTENHFFDENTEKRISDYLRSKQNLKYLLVLQIADEIFSDIQKGRFLTFDKKLIFSLSPVARKLFLLIKKQHITKKRQSFSCAFLASRIPLSWKSSVNIKDAVNSIEKAAEMLKNKGLIEDYNLILQKPKRNSYIDFTFTDGD